MKLDDLQVGGQLLVGTGVYPAIKSGPERINGSAALEGPVVIGAQNDFGKNTATLMVGETTNNDPDCVGFRKKLGISGTKPVAVHAKGGFYLDGDLFVTGSVDCESTGRLEERHQVADDSPKLFDMKHPSPEMEGYRLAHACIEGPEVGVYYRGRLRNEKEIVLPDYWKDLVHVNSISVQLQSIGAHQDIIVKRWDIEKIYLQSKSGIPIDCFYHVYAERKDVNALVVEYEGETYEDRPDREGNDPKYADNVNTRTL